MLKFRHLFMILLLLPFSAALKAQDDIFMAGLRVGHNTSFGHFAAVSLETVQTMENNFTISGGAQHSTIGRTAVEARPAYFRNYTWGKMTAEALLSYTNLASVHNMAVGGGAGLAGRWIELKLGYYYRLYGRKGDSIGEPFNIYYELCANLLPMIEDWNLHLAITNNEIFELERHYQPSFIAKGTYCPREHLGVFIAVGCKPAGMFHLSADYYQSFLKSGVFYRW